jgi:uncharacterized protein YqgV (UPF0045/DUF77 family)
VANTVGEVCLNERGVWVIEKVIENLFRQVVEVSFRRQPDAKSERKIKISLRKLLMDSVSLSKRAKRQQWASIHKNSNHYTASRYHNPDLTYRVHVERVYSSLLQLGYLLEVKSGLYTEKDRYLTRYEATPKLIALMGSSDIATLPVEQPIIENPELVRVRMKIDGQKKLVDYSETNTTSQMRSNLNFINSVLQRQWFDLELKEDELEQLEQRMHQQVLERNDGEGRLRLQDRQLYRVFNSLDFDEGGRFYGGWWEVVPSEYRHRILIDGKRTVELDFGTLHPTILYARASANLSDDAYEIDLRPSCIPEGSTGSDFRKIVKRAFNAMLNANHRLQQPPRGLDIKGWGIKWAEIVEAIQSRHEVIANQFFTGAGLRLQFDDSQIAEEIMVDFATSRGMVPLLPVHDSFICHHGYVEEVKKMMRNKFKQKFGVDIKVKESLSSPSRFRQDSDDSLSALLSYENRSHDLRLDRFRSRSSS